MSATNPPVSVNYTHSLPFLLGPDLARIARYSTLREAPF
jgi:hypothetical protein